MYTLFILVYFFRKYSYFRAFKNTLFSPLWSWNWQPLMDFGNFRIRWRLRVHLYSNTGWGFNSILGIPDLTNSWVSVNWRVLISFMDFHSSGLRFSIVSSLKKKSPRAGDRVVSTPTLGLIPGTPEGKGLKHKQKDHLEQPNRSEIAKFTVYWVARRITELTVHTGIFDCSTSLVQTCPLERGLYLSQLFSTSAGLAIQLTCRVCTCKESGCIWLSAHCPRLIQMTN